MYGVDGFGICEGFYDLCGRGYLVIDEEVELFVGKIGVDDW